LRWKIWAAADKAISALPILFSLTNHQGGYFYVSQEFIEGNE
jgi:hypothetical protein